MSPPTSATRRACSCAWTGCSRGWDAGRPRSSGSRSRSGRARSPVCASGSRPRSGSRSGPSASSCPFPRWRRSRCRPRAAGPVAPLVDARRGEVYAGLYEASAAGPRELQADRCCALADWLASLPGSDAPLALLGSGVAPHRAELEAALGARARFLPEAAGVLRARTVGRLGAAPGRERQVLRAGSGRAALSAARGGRGEALGFTLESRTHTLEPTPIRPRNRYFYRPSRTPQ